MNRIAVALVSVLGALAAAPSFGWNNVGHMAVAAIAYDRLTPQARARVNALLKRNPDHAKWVAAAGSNDADKVAFMRSASWPDDIKFNPEYKDDSQASATAAKVTGYADKTRHKYWHYMDTPFSTDGTALPQVKAPNAQTQIAALRAVLASDANDDVKSYALAWLNHLVGDVHQPLHSATRFSAAHPKGDAGGNGVDVCAGSCGPLHAFWDQAVGSTGWKEQPTTRALKLQTRLASYKVPAGPAAKLDEKTWVSESAALARKYAYAAPVATAAASAALDQTYRNNAGSIAEQRVALAGVRLANLLNASLQ